MDDVNSLLEAAHILREAADDVERYQPVQSSQLRSAMVRLDELGFSRTFVAKQIAEWLEAEADAFLVDGAVLTAALEVAEKVRRES